MIKNSLSIDLESHLHREFNPKKRLYSDNLHTVQATNLLLNLLNQYKTKLTFFVTGEIYEWYPDLIETIHSKGHEIAYHSHRHLLLKTTNDLLTELKLSKKFLARYKPIGFRAPKMIFKKKFYKILADFGFKYDSSLYGSYKQIKTYSGVKEIPVSLFSYGFSQQSLSFPQSFKQAVFQGIPFGSGLFISLFPKLTQYFISKINSQNQPAVLVIHPWQVINFPDTKNLQGLSNFPRRILYKKPIYDILNALLKRNEFTTLKSLIK